jgi:MATE family multidrug resistance protein
VPSSNPGFLKITVPVALSYFGIMLLGTVDLILVGRLGPAAQGAVGVGTSIFAWFLVFGIGLLSSMDYLVSVAFGAGRREDAVTLLIQAVWLSLVVGIPFSFLLWMGAPMMAKLGLTPEVTPLAESYLRTLALSLWPVYGFAAARNYLQAIHRVWEALALLILANGLNYWLNLSLIPQLGVDGSAWATVVSRYFMALALLGVAAFHARTALSGKKAQWRLKLRTQIDFLKIGVPAALQSTAEVGVFALSTLIAARFSSEALAAHQIVLNLASMTFMVPLGIGTAAAVSVGFFLGRREPALARHQGWFALKATLTFMAFTATLFVIQGKSLLGFYSNNPEVLKLAFPALMVAAFFQLSDGTQTVLTGALRGGGDTQGPFIANLWGHWLLGLPLGLLLGFHFKLGILGVWLGLATGLTCVALRLIRIWRLRSQSF